MFNPSIRALTLAATFVAGTLSLASTANAAPFDGSWSVLVSTTSGPCEQAYTYNVMINNGVLSGGGVVSLSGRVAQNGSLSVTVSNGGQNAHGSGRLTRNSGAGTWHGSGPSGTCSGSWSAERG